MSKSSLQIDVSRFPISPGVYLMHDADGTVIYVGKAKNIRSRVKSYFARETDIKTTVLVRKIDRIEYIVTQNEYEALLLENNLIKKHAPRYNINLKDGKSYPVIRITNEQYPRVFRTRKIVQDGSQYFGPFPHVESIDRYLDLTERLFPLRKCRKPVTKKQHPCLYYHIGRCAAVCAGKTTQEEYNQRVDSIRRLLNGETRELIAELETKMHETSKRREFEKAASYRDSIRAIETLETEQNIIDFDPDVRDYLGFATGEDICAIVVFQMRGGKLIDTHTYYAPMYDKPQEVIEQFLLQFYAERGTIPTRLFVPESFDSRMIARFFEHEQEATVQTVVPVDRRDRAVLNLAIENARSSHEKRMRESGNLPALEELRSVLGLRALPLRIEGFDIAHIGGKHTVASMVSFQNGVPDKNEYRRYHVRTVEGRADDFASIREVVARRYTRIVNERLPKPDLIVIDGGIGQVNSAADILAALQLESIPVIGLAKKNEEIFFPRSDPVTLPDGSPPLRVLQYIRDEAHRFATTFRAGLQSKEIADSRLESVPGIGPTRSRRLLEAFGSIEAVAEAPADALYQAGLPRAIADAVHDAMAEYRAERIERPNDEPDDEHPDGATPRPE